MSNVWYDGRMHALSRKGLQLGWGDHVDIPVAGKTGVCLNLALRVEKPRAYTGSTWLNMSPNHKLSHY